MLIDVLKLVARPFYRTYVRLTQPVKSRHEIHKYWRQPWDGINLPQQYAQTEGGKLERSRAQRTDFLRDLVRKYSDQNAVILEIGCNVGRNLNGIYSDDYKNLHGIEISSNAVKMLKQIYPAMAKHAKIYNLPVEDKIKEFADSQFDIVYTMAVLEHIHTDSEWIFQEMVRITNKNLIIIEHEYEVSWKHFPRNYQKVFESLGMKQIEFYQQVPGLNGRFVARVFEKNRN